MKFENLNLGLAILSGHDLMGCAQTGTGKTCAFAVSIINKLLRKRICLQK